MFKKTLLFFSPLIFILLLAPPTSLAMLTSLENGASQLVGKYLKKVLPRLHKNTRSQLPDEKRSYSQISCQSKKPSFLPQQVKIELRDQLTRDMDQLRLKCFPLTLPQLTSRDEFDERSQHMGIYVDGDLAAYGRLTPGPKAVFETWSQGYARVPTGQDVLDLGRCCVHPNYRGSLLYEAIILKGFQYAERGNFRSVVGSYELGRYVGTRCLKLGFQHHGAPCWLKEPDGDKFFVQPIVFNIKPGHYDWERLVHKSLYDSPEKFWQNMVHLDIKTLNREDFINNHSLIQEIMELSAPSYEDPTAVVYRDLNHSNKLYLTRDGEGKLTNFFMVGWEPISFEGSFIPSVFMGLSATRQDLKNTGITRLLFNRFIEDAQIWEEQHQQRLLLWYTTATPSIFHAVNQMFTDNQPYPDGTYSEEGKNYVLALRKHMKWPDLTKGHPFVLKGVAEKTRYSAIEAARISEIVKMKNFTLFSDLSIDETNGDRMVRICSVPLRR